MWGASHVAARSASWPPLDSATIRAPAAAAAWAASMVSSVLPEKDTAKHRVPSSTNEGAS